MGKRGRLQLAGNTEQIESSSISLPRSPFAIDTRLSAERFTGEPQIADLPDSFLFGCCDWIEWGIENSIRGSRALRFR